MKWIFAFLMVFSSSDIGRSQDLTFEDFLKKVVPVIQKSQFETQAEFEGRTEFYRSNYNAFPAVWVGVDPESFGAAYDAETQTASIGMKLEPKNRLKIIRNGPDPLEHKVFKMQTKVVRESISQRQNAYGAVVDVKESGKLINWILVNNFDDIHGMKVMSPKHNRETLGGSWALDPKTAESLFKNGKFSLRLKMKAEDFDSMKFWKEKSKATLNSPLEESVGNFRLPVSILGIEGSIGTNILFRTESK